MKQLLCGLIIMLIAAADSAWPEDALDALTRQQHYEARRESSSNPDLKRNGDARGIAPGETLVLADVDGPGIVTHFWNTIAAFDPFHGRSVVIRIYYDGNQSPSVQAPLGDFFGVGHGALKNITSQPVSISAAGRARTCYWRMPFQKHIKITATNEHATAKVDSFYYYIDWQKHESLPEDTAYFHAEYRQAHPAKPGNYTILETTGRGHYVGTVYSAHQMETGWFGEGDDFFYIDGAELPQLRGTGTEDYFNDAWGFREFNTPYYGVSLYEGVLAGDRLTAYRWHIPDPIPFKQSLHLEIEHRGSVYNERGSLTNFELGTFEERQDWLSSVAYWYQYPPKEITEALPPAEERVAPYRVLNPVDLGWKAEPSFIVVPSDTGVIYAPSTRNAKIEFEFDLEEDGTYQLAGYFIFSVLSGVYQPYLDDAPFGEPVDFSIINYDMIYHTLDTHNLKAGKHTLRFEGVDQQPANARAVDLKFNLFGLVRLTVLRLEDMQGFRAESERLLKGE